MNLEEKNKTRKKLYLVLAVFLLLIALNLIIYLVPVEYNRVKIFILDDFQQSGETYGNLSISHGELVRDVITGINKNLALNLHNVSSSSGIKEELYLAGLADAIDYKRSNPKQEVIINVSLSFSDYTSEHRDYITKAREEGIIIVAAAGNDNSTTPIYPAGFSDVIAVANAQRIRKTQSSNYGEYIDLSAPGDAGGIITGSLAEGFGFSYIRTHGTSFSAPRVVATLAKVLELDDKLAAEQALEIIKSNSSRIFAKEYQAGKLGSGLLNYSRVLRRVDFKYWLIERLPIFTLILLLLMLAVLMLLRYKIVGIFFIILAVIVLFPTTLFISENMAEGLISLHNNLLLFGFSNFSLIYIILVGVMIYKFSYWSIKIRLALLFGLGLINLALVSYAKTLKLNYLLTTLLLLITIGLEWSSAKLLANKNDLKQLLMKLDSRSNKLQLTAKKRLLSRQDLSFNRLKKELDNSNSVTKTINLLELLLDKNFAKSKEVLLNYLYHPQAKIYLTAFKYLAKDSTYTKQLINFAVSKDIKKKELLIAFKNADKAVIKELLLILAANNQRQQELVVAILKEQSCKRIINILEIMFTKDIKLDKLWHCISDCQVSSQILSNHLLDLIFRTNEMWTCYYALKILFKLHPYPKSLIPVLEILKDKQEEIISLEARNILEEIKA